MRLKTATAMGLALAVTGTMPALAQTTYTYSDIDTDGNLELSSVEFQNYSGELFGLWDADSDGMIVEQEFLGGLYDTWDDDADGLLTEAEYSDGWDLWFDDYETIGYGGLDRDGYLTEDEFNDGFMEARLFDNWSDGELGQEEFATVLYGVYDSDDNLTISQVEYDATPRLETFGYNQATTLETNEILSLADWRYDDIYAGGISAEEFIDEMEVYGVTGEEIGEVEDLVIGPDGRVLSVIAEVGGFWDIGDTHVNIPFEEVSLADDSDGIMVPLTGDSVSDYDLWTYDAVSADEAGSQTISGVDDMDVVRAWRVSELIGDTARLQDGDIYSEFGYINDLILRDGEVAAVVTNASSAYGAGYQAYPFYGYDYDMGWDAGSPYYDLPYTEDEIGELERFDYERIGS
ncbi:PRC-barrel domain-containing protein [Tateyamaria sp. syn59]|uniref:PRC-barrel domain-containing protein n=1 Tax=Tateyamaria sp. syn59 TaxID=2576942 RepID=UPI0011BE9B90|nr:PRC-barrel domain-containing protein [Tateyamaria sp. syn59]